LPASETLKQTPFRHRAHISLEQVASNTSVVARINSIACLFEPSSDTELIDIALFRSLNVDLNGDVGSIFVMWLPKVSFELEKKISKISKNRDSLTLITPLSLLARSRGMKLISSVF